MRQIVTPNPHIPCQPGWCLQYVRQAFGLPARHPTATAAWEASTSKHRDRNFPKGAWLPVWFSLANEPAGHVALMAPDGTVFSTSDLGSVPHQHLDLSDLMNYYARYDMTLTYLGWTEDVAGYPVLAADGINPQGTITPQASTESEEDFMGGFIDKQQAEDIAKRAAELVLAALDGKVKIHPVQAESIVKATTARTVDGVDARNKGKLINAQQADDIARAAARYTEEEGK